VTALIRYEAARSALAECKRVDEVKDIIDKAEAMRVYGRMANDVSLEIDAAEIRLRAERRLGQIEAQLKAEGRLSRGGRPAKTGSDEEPVSTVTLAELGIDKKLSSRAQKVGGIAEQAFERMIANMRRDIAAGRVRVSLDLLKEDDKKERRARREMVLGGIQQAFPKKRYGIILADPEWRFEVYSRDTGMDRAADNHYPTSSTDAICARPVGDIAADDCVLYLWATSPMLPDALKVMQAWGFDYKSHQVWRKDRIGTGYWFRNLHELILVGTKGNPPAPAMGTQEPSVFDAPVGRHSAKPECVQEMIERHFPNMPKIELNRRGPARPGWDAWGNEADDGSPTDPQTGEIIETDVASSSVTSEQPAAVHTVAAVTPPADILIEDVPSFLRAGSSDDYRGQIT